ncbi:unnamed protein product [Ceutorhynchus assimilis]|uniref:SUN domain-containing protein n=1 Tax=Ceutorhynchus assimilis TaxID=467358 RepID=A0A9N9N2Y5_9CUCU|nr:unnamed protein product [Ceutorhynchus assimilis]
MELRPRNSRTLSRSKSRTPFLVQEIEAEIQNQAEKTIVKTTRKTVTTTVLESNESASSSTDEINTQKTNSNSVQQQKSEGLRKSLRNRLIKTSDYSSEDGEAEVSSSKTIHQNERNQLLEDARGLVNGSGTPALDLYKKSGRYWEKYPKTDWTYSHHSKDRVEIAPGVVAMPNMSRRTIHSLDNYNVSHKNTNTDYTTSNIGYRSQDSKNEDYFIKRRTYTSTHTRWSVFKQKVSTTIVSILTMFSFVYRAQTGLFSQIHRAASKVMLCDTYLLSKMSGNKLTKLGVLCFVPLLLFGGFWLLSDLYNYPFFATNQDDSLGKDQIETIVQQIQPTNTKEIVDKLISDPNFIKIINNNYQQSNQDLLKEIENMKQLITLNNQLRQDEYSKLLLDMKKCCKRPIINIEGHLTKLLNDPQFLKNQKGLNEYLQALFIAKQHLEYHLGNLTQTIDLKIANLQQSDSEIIMDKVAANLLKPNQNVDIQKLIKQALIIYDADRTGLVDYAMENMGGQIVTTRCTELYHHGTAVVSVLGIPLWHRSNSPRTVITPTMAPGDCWAFQNFPGFVVVKLSGTVKIDAFSMEHISRLLVPEEKMDSAPKEFEVYGLQEENDKNPVLLGKYLYDYHGDSLQFFTVEKDNQVFDLIEIRIVSNHGNPNYTCLYRFRVHGKLLHQNSSR